jgi:hypothetical protein
MVGNQPESNVRAPSAVAAVGGIVIAVSFFLLPWESFELTYGVGGPSSEVTNAGHELRIDNDAGDPVQGYLVASTLFTAGLAILLFPLSLITSVGRHFFPLGLVVAVIAVAWIAYSVIFLGKYEVDTAIGVPIAWFGAALVALGAVAGAVLSRRATPIPASSPGTARTTPPPD